MICPIRINCRAIISLMLLLALVVLFANAIADESMELIATIVIERDSTYMTSLTPIGDFNADGHPDIAIGVRQDLPNLYEALYLYFGGADFDSLPDLIIPGEPQNTDSYCFYDLDLMTFFGTVVTGLSDHNGDGYDDIAVAAPEFCTNLYREGKIYIYLGSPEPDTVADLIISGQTYFGYLGHYLNSGNYNGDDFGDLLAIAPQAVHDDARAYIYTGSHLPDETYDWLYNTEAYQDDIITDWYKSGFDLNYDGFDDFALTILDPDSSFNAIFLGGDPINDEPNFSVYNQTVAFTDDISDDGIDDVLIRQSFFWYLCLGGNPLDQEPDYYIGDQGFSPFTYTLVGDGLKLMLDDRTEHSYIMYNTGVPFDTIPLGTFGYDQLRRYNQPNIGDINADGIEDLALLVRDDTLVTYAKIYSIFRTDIADDRDIRLPEDRNILSCYPNPFNTSAVLTLKTTHIQSARIEIYDIMGSFVCSIAMEGGKATWDATDNSGRKVSSGIYFARVETPQKSRAIKLLYLK